MARSIPPTNKERKETMATGKVLDGKPYAGNPHVAPSQCYGGTSRFDEGEVAPCTAEASLRRVHCRRQPEGRASVCAATPRRGSLLYTRPPNAACCPKWKCINTFGTIFAQMTTSVV